MTARIHSIAVHRLAVPAWLLVAVLDNPAEPIAAPSQAPVAPACIDSSVTGHC